MFNRGTVDKQALHDLLVKLYATCNKTDEQIRWLAKRKNELTKRDRKEFEHSIQTILANLGKQVKKIPNVDLVTRYTELTVLWNEYQSGMEIKSAQEEKTEAEVALNEVMGQYNREHFGTGGQRK